MKSYEVHDYLNDIGGSSFSSATGPITGVPFRGNVPVIKATTLLTPKITPVVMPTMPVVGQPPPPLVPTVGGGYDSPLSMNSQQAMTRQVVMPRAYFERKAGRMFTLRGKLQSFPTCIIQKKEVVNSRVGAPFIRVERMIGLDGEPVDCTIYPNGTPRYIYVRNFQIAANQMPAYYDADGESKSTEAKAAAVKPTSEIKPLDAKKPYEKKILGLHPVTLGMGTIALAAGVYFLCRYMKKAKTKK